jgi:hypothetical protein
LVCAEVSVLTIATNGVLGKPPCGYTALADLYFQRFTRNNVHGGAVIVGTGCTTACVTGATSSTTGNLKNFNLTKSGWNYPTAFTS